MTQELERGAGLTLALDAQGTALLATVTPVPEAAPIDEEWLRAHIAERGFGALRYLPAAGTILLGQYNSGAPVVALRLAECVDASFKLTLAPDGLSVQLDIIPAQGGKPVDFEAVLTDLATMGVIWGIDHSAIRKAITEGAARGLTIAEGQAPVNGEDGRLETFVSGSRDRRPRELENGRVDYRDLGEIAVVHPGEKLMRRVHATPGTPGRTVLGVSLPAKAGKEVSYASQLSGVAFDPENPDVLVAALAGLPVQVPGGLVVEPVYATGEVSTGSGNISFEGSVVIKGDVYSGMTVRATGDIEIGGMVEAATLEAGGSIVVKGGVVGGLGRKESAEHVVRCGGSFNAAFAQQARIEAGDSIFIDDTAIQCELTAANHILVGGKRRGHIIGGKAQAALSIKGKVLGSPNRVATYFEIGIDPAMHRLLQEKARTREGHETQLLEIGKLLDFASQNPQRITPEIQGKARATAKSLSAEIAKLRAEESVLQKKAAMAQQSRVIAEQAMYEGVVVIIGNGRYRVVGERGPGSIGMGRTGIGLLGPDEL